MGTALRKRNYYITIRMSSYEAVYNIIPSLASLILEFTWGLDLWDYQNQINEGTLSEDFESSLGSIPTSDDEFPSSPLSKFTPSTDFTTMSYLNRYHTVLLS